MQFSILGFGWGEVTSWFDSPTRIGNPSAQVRNKYLCQWLGALHTQAGVQVWWVPDMPIDSNHQRGHPDWPLATDAGAGCLDGHGLQWNITWTGRNLALPSLLALCSGGRQSYLYQTIWSRCRDVVIEGHIIELGEPLGSGKENGEGRGRGMSVYKQPGTRVDGNRGIPIK